MMLPIRKKLIPSLFIFTAIIFAYPLTTFAEEGESGVKYEAGFYYTIQKGDTLWDISKRFSDSPWQWPDLWHENKQITNPHLIYPGERIRLFHKEGVANLVSNKTVTEITDSDSFQKELQKEEPQKELPYYLYTSIDRVGFIKKDPVTPCGFIFKVKDDKEMIHQGDLVYLKPNNKTASPFMPGSRYIIYRTLPPIKDKKTKAYIGIQHYLTGVVEITKKEAGFAVAKVVKSYRAIRLNDLLMPYKSRSPKIILTESKDDIYGKIIISEEHSQIIGDNTIAFIDKGEKDGILPGQFYSIYDQQKRQIDQHTGEEIIFPPVDYGTLLVLDTEPTTSTVLITRAERNIRAGAKIRTPVR